MAGKKKWNKWGKKTRFDTGEYHPKNKDKYKGKLPIIFRSSWEKQAMWWLDNHPGVVSWGAESTVIPYYFKGKRHRYFIDLTATFTTSTGHQKYLIEIKPYKQTIPPVDSPRKKKKTLMQEAFTYGKNQAKWDAATAYAKRKGWKFIVVTEKQLFKDN